MSLTDDYCNSNKLDADEKILYYKTSSLFFEMLKDLDKKGFLRSEIKAQIEGQKRFLNVMHNVRKISKAFNSWFDVYADGWFEPNGKKRLKKILEIGKLSEEDAVYLLFSQMIFVFLQNIEELRSALLFILNLPISVPNNRPITEKTTLNQLFRGLKELGIKNIDSIIGLIDGDLRNGLSHSLFWFELGDVGCSELHLHYSKDIKFNSISSPIAISDFFKKTRKQSLITNCLLNVIADWF